MDKENEDVIKTIQLNGAAITLLGTAHVKSIKRVFVEKSLIFEGESI